MIFISVGTQKFQFDRLFKFMDELLEEKKIQEEVFAQTGFSDYKPKNYQSVPFLSWQDLKERIKNCDTLIVHGGVGSLLYGLKANKKIIAFPRLAKYDEHIDDHQMEIVTKFTDLGYILSCRDKQSLEECLSKINTFESKYEYREEVDTIADYLLDYLSRINR